MNCCLCPRQCGVDRINNIGFCRMGKLPKAARAGLHRFEEPIISGWRGSGTVFFSGCNLRCVYCQNHPISHEDYGKYLTIEQLSEVFINLQQQGAHNINLVNPTHFSDVVISSIKTVKDRISIPFVWNSSGYERDDTLKKLEGLIEIYLPDLKYFSSKISGLYSKAGDYFKYASKAILEMYRQVGGVRLNKDGLMERGLMIRHLVLPNLSHDSVKVLKWIKENIPGDVYISLMGQYTPTPYVESVKGLNRRTSKREYDFVMEKLGELGIKNGFTQGLDSACPQYTPEFDLTGL